MTGELYCLDRDSWVEIPDRMIIKAGTTYIGKEFKPDESGNPTYEIRVFVRKICSESFDLESAYEYVRQCARQLNGITDIDPRATWWVVTMFGIDVVKRTDSKVVSDMITAYTDMHVLAVENGTIVEYRGPKKSNLTSGADYPHDA